MLLCHVLCHHMNLDVGYSLITEVHQLSELDSIDIVVLDIPEAEALVAMINKQLSVYLSNYLVDAGIGKVFVNTIIQGAIFLALNYATGTCTGGSNKKTVTTPDDAEQERWQVLEDAAWYKYEYGAHMSTKGRHKKKEYTSPEMLYDIDGENPSKRFMIILGKVILALQVYLLLIYRAKHSIRRMSSMRTLPMKAVISPTCQDTN